MYVDPREEKILETDLAVGDMRKPRLPNWRVVTYQFTPIDEDSPAPEVDGEGEKRTGFSRREIAWEDLIAGRTSEEILLEMPGAGTGSESSTGEEVMTEIEGANAEQPVRETSPEEAADIREGKEDRIDLPQIITCRFRYFMTGACGEHIGRVGIPGVCRWRWS